MSGGSDLLAAGLEGDGPAVAEMRSGAVLSRADLRAAVAARAGAIAAHLTPGRRNVLIAHGGSADFLADLFAVWAAGGTAVPVGPNLTAGEVGTLLEFAEVALVLARGDLPVAPGVPVFQAPETAADRAPLPVGPMDAALILFTSGSTGAPKGVVLSHRAVAERVRLNLGHLQKGTVARTLCLLPTHFGHGLIGTCLTPLLGGGQVVFPAADGIGAAAGLGAAVDDLGVTFLSSVPALWKMALRLGPPPGAESLRRVSIGSAPLSADLWRGVAGWAGGAEVANMYGLTETANWVAGASSADHAPEDGLVGRPWGGAARVRQSDGTVASSGRGEILLRVPSVMSGYLHRPDLTGEVLSEGWYATGDIGGIDAGGLIRLTGRARYLIIQSGINIFPEELDALLERHDDVLEAAAFAEADPVAGQSAAVAVVLKPGRETGVQDLVDWVRREIRPEAAPRRIVLADALPRNERGKINRDDLARAFGAGP